MSCDSQCYTEKVITGGMCMYVIQAAVLAGKLPTSGTTCSGSSYTSNHLHLHLISQVVLYAVQEQHAFPAAVAAGAQTQGSCSENTAATGSWHRMCHHLLWSCGSTASPPRPPAQP